MTGLVLLALGALLWVPGSTRGRLRDRPRPHWRLARPSPRRPGTVAVVELMAALRDELQAGAALATAFERAVHSSSDPGVCSQALAVCQMGGDVPAALREQARDHPPLLSLAALWQVSEGSGAALAGALDRLVASADQSAALRREVRAQLAGPRGTVRVLAVLPLVGVGMGLLMGADPVGFLLGTPWGVGCLLGALVLEAAGVLWMRRLVSAIEEQL